MINISDIPTEPSVTIIDPEGAELITTNNITAFDWIRLEIKKQKLEGYKVRDEYGNIYDIHTNGKIFLDGMQLVWPANMPGSVFEKILFELI
jgi:hypothetical protein